MKFWNEDRTQIPAIDIGDLEKYMSQETATGAGNVDPIEEENAPEENGKTLAENGGTPHLNNGNTTQGSARSTDQDDLASTHEMAFHLGLPSPEPPDLRGGNVSENRKKFKTKVRKLRNWNWRKHEGKCNQSSYAANSHWQRCYRCF